MGIRLDLKCFWIKENIDINFYCDCCITLVEERVLDSGEQLELKAF